MRRALRPGLIALGVLATLILTIATGARGQQFSWRQAQGTEIRVLALRFWYPDLLKSKLQEFEQLTGIKVVIEDLPEDPFRQKLAVEMAAQNKGIDVFTTGPSYEGRRFAASGWYVDLAPLIADGSATSPDWDAGDFIESVWKLQQLGGKHVGVPTMAITQVLFYRKDLFDAAALKPPRTLDDLEAAAKRLHQPPSVYGFVSRGRKTQAPYSWAHFLHAHGGSWIGPDGKAGFASPAGHQATAQYARILRAYGDPGVADNGPVDVQTQFAQGRAAMILDTTSWAGIFNDPAKSKVVGKWAVAPAPTGSAGVTYELWSWSFAISPFSEKKRAAWLFVQWATSREMQRILQSRNFPMPRKSLWEDTDWRAKVDPTWHSATVMQYQTARSIGHPPVVATPEVVDAVGTAINNALAGRDPKVEIEAAARRVNEILERTEPRR